MASQSTAKSMVLAMRLAAARRAAAQRSPASPLPDDLAPDHPLVQALGEERARLVMGGHRDAREAEAERRRGEVARLTREGKLVREIAAELALSYNHVVAIREQLGIGKRP